METKELERLLENDRFRHLSEAILVSYRDGQLDQVGLALADAHLNLCEICKRQLTFLKEAQEAIDTYVTTNEDRALIERSIRKLQPERNADDYFRTEIRRLRSYFEALMTDWVLLFSKPAMRGTGDGDEVWRYESKDGLLTGWAILESDASLTVHFSSSELAWEGARIRFRLGPFSKEFTLQRAGDSEVAAKIKIPRPKRAKKMRDISIEIV